ncbi:MAG TPA: hypothetical protein VLA44_01570 [Clostridia bacterium]|nr:hypothetical protein [Clostridia bacterium]
MDFDIGIQGFGILLVISLIFGLVAQLVGRNWTRWLWLAAAAGWFAGGLFASEVLWGDMTEAEIQPIIDGLAFDESLLGGLIGGLLVVLAAWLVTHNRGVHRPRSV